MQKTVCDICGCNVAYPREYQIKINKKQFVRRKNYFWKKIDICPECQEKIIEYCMNSKDK